MLTLNHFFGGPISQAPAVRIGNFVAQFNVIDFLYSRGFENVSEAGLDETLMVREANIIFDQEVQKTVKPRWDFMELFAEKDFRIQVKRMIYKGEPSTHPMLAKFQFEATSKNENRYTRTVELLLAYLSISKLKAFSASYGIKIEGTPYGGDFDCIANFQNQLVYFEVKSGNVSNLDPQSFQAFFERHFFLSPYASILFLDYEGGEAKLDGIISGFKNQNIGSRKIEMIRKVFKGSKKLYVIESDLIIVDVHNDGNILSNLRFALQYVHRHQSYQKNFSFKLITPSELGYDSKVL